MDVERAAGPNQRYPTKVAGPGRRCPGGVFGVGYLSALAKAVKLACCAILTCDFTVKEV